MAPTAPNKSINIGELSTQSLIANNPWVAQPLTRNPVAFDINPQDLFKPIIAPVIKTPQQLMKPMSQNIPVSTPQTLPTEQPTLTSNTLPAQAPKLSIQEFAQIIKTKNPEYAQIDDKQLVDKMIAKYPTYVDRVDYNISNQITQAPVRVEPQFAFGANKLQDQTQPIQGGLRRGISWLWGDWWAAEWINPVGKVFEWIDNAMQKIPVVTKSNIENAFNKLVPWFGDSMTEWWWPNVIQMLANVPWSLLKTASATARWVTNPVDTLQWLYKLVATNEWHQTIKDRYGSMDNFAKSMDQDPVWVASDILTVVQGGAGIVSKWARIAGAGAKVLWATNTLWKLTAFADDASRLWATAWWAADLWLWEVMAWVNQKVSWIANTPLRIAAKTALAPTRPIETILENSKNPISKENMKERADQMLTNMNRITKPQQEKFAQMAGETVGEFLNNRGITEWGDKSVAKIADKFVESMTKADQWLDAIKWLYKNEDLWLMIDDTVRYAKATLNPEADRLVSLQAKHSAEGVTMTETNEVKRFFQKNNKFSYWKDITAGEKTARATNLDTRVRDRQFKTADENGFGNLKQINKETQGYRYLLDKITKNENGRLGNNSITLTDWIVAGQVAIDPSAIALLVGKKVASSNWFRSGVVKILNKVSSHKNIWDLTLDLGKIQQIQDEKSLNKYLSLPLKENVNTPTLNLRNSANGNAWAIVWTNAVLSPKATVKPQTIVRETWVATKPGTTKWQDIVKKMDEQLRAKKAGENSIATELKRLESDPTLEKAHFNDVTRKWYLTQYWPIDKIEQDRGREVYEIKGKSYKAGEVEIFKTKQVVKPVVRKYTSAQDLKIDSLKQYKQQGQRRASYLNDYLNWRSIDDLTGDQVDKIHELINKRKRDDGSIAEAESVIWWENPVKTAPKITPTSKIDPKQVTTPNKVNDELQAIAKQVKDKTSQQVDLTKAPKTDIIDTMKTTNLLHKEAKNYYSVQEMLDHTVYYRWETLWWSNYYSTDFEYDKDFTPTWLNSEVKKVHITQSDIFVDKELPSANSELEITSTINKAKKLWKKAIMVSEWKWQPKSIFVFDKSSIKTESQLRTQREQANKPTTK